MSRQTPPIKPIPFPLLDLARKHGAIGVKPVPGLKMPMGDWVARWTLQQPEVLGRLQLMQPFFDRTHKGLSTLAPVIGQALERFRTEWMPGIGKIGQAFAEYPDRVRPALVTMARHGWYMDDQMGLSEPIRFGQSFDEGCWEDAQNELVAHFDERTSDIHAALDAQFPNRAPLFASAFRAHKDEQYFAAIPLFLAQADGICHDVLSTSLFMRKGPAGVRERMKADSPFLEALLSPLSEDLAISRPQKKREDNFKALNRHMVMHGESLDYGTHLFSLQAISLVNYLAQNLERVMEKARDEQDTSS